MKPFHGRGVDAEAAAENLTAAYIAGLQLAHAEMVFTQKSRCISVEG